MYFSEFSLAAICRVFKKLCVCVVNAVNQIKPNFNKNVSSSSVMNDTVIHLEAGAFTI